MKNTILKGFILNALLLCLFFSETRGQVPLPAAPQKGNILLKGATAHIGNGEVITNSLISIVAGKLALVTDATTAKIDENSFKEILDITGQHVYPGLILPNSTLGLEEISAVRATRDHSETGSLNPNVRSLIAYNTDSHIIPTLRYTGVLLVQTCPQGGLVSGTSSVMKLDGWNWEDAAYKIDDAVHVRWPRKMYGPRWWLGETKNRENKNYKENIAELDELFKAAQAYAVSEKAAVNLKLEALRGLFSGKKKIHLHANKRSEIIESIQWAKKIGIPHIVLVGGADAYYTIDFLKEQNIPILLDMVHRLPSRSDEDVDLPYRLPGILHKAGLLVGLTYDKIVSSRNLPFFAGTVAAHGLDPEEALSLITANTAKILGIEERTGTLTTGKDANIVVCDGDLLDMRSNIVQYAFIEGRKLNLEGKQQRLYQRFKQKYSEGAE